MNDEATCFLQRHSHPPRLRRAGTAYRGKAFKRLFFVVFCFFCGTSLEVTGQGGAGGGATDHARLNFAVERLQAAFAGAGVAATVSADASVTSDILLVSGAKELKPEHFALKREAGGRLVVSGGDDSGVLYGALELAERVRAAKHLPGTLDYSDGPELKMRGACIGMQKLSGGYLWPYTPENFPFFYDRAQWIRYLDFLLENRMNSLYLWNGHPFSSLVELADYPEAAEVSPEVLAKNREMMLWLAGECDKRGIWLIQKFYNIHLPEGLAKKYKLSTSLGQSQPVAADYTRKALAKFVEEYPSVGLLVCLGEALSGPENQVEWFTKTIIPGVQDGLKARGWSAADLADKDKLPPIVVRGHHIVEYRSHKEVLGEGMKLYPNIVSMVKFNGESLTTWEPRGKYQQYHKDMAAYTATHLANVHLLSNLEPFRYADFSFIRNSVRAIRDRLDGSGVHLYPLAYWDWPNAPDNVPGLRQLDRDRIWYEIWARYAWKIDRDPAEEKAFWCGRLEATYGTKEAAEKIYEAYDASGECAPRLLRRFGITGGNRQALSLGMTLDQMVNASKYRVWKDLRASDSPPGEDLREYVTREWKQEAHAGETPPQIIREARAFARQAVEAIEAASGEVTANQAEFARLRNDVHCIRELTEHITQTAESAMLVIRNEFSNDPADLKAALAHLEASVAAYRRLNERAGPAYRYAGSYHGRQSIPFRGPYHWSQVVGNYQKELDAFRARVAGGGDDKKTVSERDPHRKPFAAVPFKLLTPGMEIYAVEKGARVFTDRDYAIRELAPELNGLTGIRFSHGDAKRGREIAVEIEVSAPCRVLVGYFRSEDALWLQVPALEHVAHANERGGYDVLLADAVAIDKLPRVDVHAFRYAAGRQKIEMIGAGSYVILGVIPAEVKHEKREKEVTAGETTKDHQAGAITSESVCALMRQAADWQLAHPAKRINRADWAYAPFWNGLWELGRIKGQEVYAERVREAGAALQWTPIRTIHLANDHAVVQTWLDLGMRNREEAILKPAREALDAFMAGWDTETGPLNFIPKGSTRWTWCDALYMSPPAFARLAAATGEEKYLTFMDEKWWQLSDYMYDKEEHLFFRDQAFFKKREKNGQKVFWCRGNGWVVGGLVRVLQLLPGDHAIRPAYEKQFREMCARLAELQQPDGLWRTGLLDQQAYPTPETSGSGFILYALAYGVNEGLLKRERFEPAVRKGWKALSGCLTSDGRLRYVQPVGDAPGAFNPESTLPYGVGAFLLAGSEVYRMVESTEKAR